MFQLVKKNHYINFIQYNNLDQLHYLNIFELQIDYILILNNNKSDLQ